MKRNNKLSRKHKEERKQGERSTRELLLMSQSGFSYQRDDRRRYVNSVLVPSRDNRCINQLRSNYDENGQSQTPARDAMRASKGSDSGNRPSRAPKRALIGELLTCVIERG